MGVEMLTFGGRGSSGLAFCAAVVLGENYLTVLSVDRLSKS